MVPHHLRSVLYMNQTPSYSQTIQLREMAASAKAEITQIDDQLARLQAEMNLLVEKKETRCDEFHAYQAALSPARRLPYELIADIFLRVKAMGSDHGLWYPFKFLPDPESEISTHPSITMSQICSAWRSVAIQTPKLWSSVRVVDEGMHYHTKLRLLQLFCDRSSGSQLSIGIHCMHKPIEILTIYLPHTVSLTLHLHEQCFLELCELPKDSFPCMENFDFHSLKNVDAMDVDEMLHFFDAPNLSAFSYDGHFHWRGIELPPGVSTLGLDRITISQCINTLLLSRGIETFRYTTSNDNAHAISTSVVLPFLKDLEIGEVASRPSVSELLDYISVPSLDALSLCTSKRSSWPPPSILTTFISRSSCAPTTLFLYGVVMRSAEFVQIARMLPSLSHLRLECCRFVDLLGFNLEREVIDALVHKPDDNALKLLPNLKDIKMTSKSRVPDALFLEVAKSRWEPVPSTSQPSCLQSFLIHRDQPGRDIGKPERAVQLEVERLLGDGLSIFIQPLMEYRK